MNSPEMIDNLIASEVAIVGMACRFPGAKDINEFWKNLKEGVESISFFTDEELRASGIPPSVLSDPNYVRAKGVVDDVDLFDATFFGFNHREAQILDPQHRLFLECAWQAIESAGYDCENYSGRIGVYAGASMNTYLLNLYSNRDLIESIDPLQLLIASDKDFLATRVSYKLNLSGPSITVQTACSTSLVAVHLACQSLLNGECDMALAGGVSIRIPQKSGYLYREGGIVSPDGHCRAFDAKANGTVGGDGVGVVLLKRVEDALEDKDSILAIIKGSAINNDGSMKAGFTAPSVNAQAVVIAEAQAMARVEAETISYVEAHGTGTTLGDPIEIAALREAFRTSTDRNGFCAIGSVKTNIGHLDAAAGVAGLIKVVKALEEKKLPPSLHFERQNPKVDFLNSPFYVNTKLTEWGRRNGPRRAGVSSFGMGGTNVHVILEEALRADAPGKARPYQLLAQSAKTDSALEAATSNLSEYLNQNPDANLADVAFTLQVGRRAFDHRRITVCRDTKDAHVTLQTLNPQRVFTALHDSVDRPVVFMFSGQGSQYVNMGLEVYQVEDEFRKQVDLCSELLRPDLGVDLREVIYPYGSGDEDAAQLLSQTFITQAAIFVIDYALARLWMQWGLQPRAMIGHSVGEYVAACLAGVFTLEDVLRLVAARGRLMQELPAGVMLAVNRAEPDVRALMGNDISMAAINGPSNCVVSGAAYAIEAFENRLAEKGVHSRRLHTSHAFHSGMMEPILERFTKEVGNVRLNSPKIPYVSNVTGAWITEGEATNPSYWARHLRETVRFQEGLHKLLNGFDGVLLEVGPGNALATLAARHARNGDARAVLHSLRHPGAPQSDELFLLTVLGKLWLAGVQIDWPGFYVGEQRRRAPLPTYPFERQRYWVEPQKEFDSCVIEGSEKAAPPLAMHPRPNLGTAYVAPSNEVEQALADIWQELLGTDRVGVRDDFFSLGGHSLLATQLLSQLREVFEVDLPLYKLFETPTVAELALVIEEALIERIEGMTDDDARNSLNMLS
jgi:phthiocerol/phenolphthiocerol synthesis type-I polyketide synthase E